METREIALLAVNALEDKKAEDIRIIDISNISTIADYFIVRQIEGYQNANWILMDFQDIIIHIFDRENRLFYDLERIWRDGVLIEKEALQ